MYVCMCVYIYIYIYIAYHMASHVAAPRNRAVPRRSARMGRRRSTSESSSRFRTSWTCEAGRLIHLRRVASNQRFWEACSKRQTTQSISRSPRIRVKITECCW